MNTHEHHLNINFTARYYTYGNLTPQTQTVWFALHGYGQLAKYFIRKFEVLDPQKNFVVAPEGLNRFYLKGFDGRVGANWMTREDRLTDIQNYVTLLNTIHQKNLNAQAQPEVNILGFSQGAVTACRWVASGDVDFDRLILWAGIYPHDMDMESARKMLQGKELKFVAGDRDEYLTADRMAEMQLVSQKLHVSPEMIRYSGGHTVDTATLKRIAGEK